MKLAKRLLICMLLLMMTVTMGVEPAYAATTVTAKSVMKKALKYKQKSTDNVVIDYKVNYNVKTTMSGETHDLKSVYKMGLQIKGSKILGKVNVAITSEGETNKSTQYFTCNSKTKKSTYYLNDGTDSTYYRSTSEDDGSYTNMIDFSNLYPYLSSVKFSNKNAKKDGIDAYYITANLDIAKLFANAGDDDLTESMASLFGSIDKTSGVKGKVKAYVNKKTGQLIYIKIGMKNYMTLAATQIYSSQFENYQSLLGDEFKFEVNADDSEIVIRVNPKTYTKITMPKKYVDQK